MVLLYNLLLFDCYFEIQDNLLTLNQIISHRNLSGPYKLPTNKAENIGYTNGTKICD